MAEPVIPKQHKAVVYDKPGTISTKIVMVDTPEPGIGEVLIHLTHSGVCFSDIGVMTNTWQILPYPTQPGQVGGHEGVGKVVKLGQGSEASGVKVGDRVGVKWIAYACGNCRLPCRSGLDGTCFKQKISGYYHPGTYQQYVVGPATYVTPIPESLPSDVAAPMLCAGVTVYAALKRSRAQAGDWVVICGAGGGLGHLGVQLASRGMGLRVIGVDHGSKENLVKDSGAEHFIDLTKYPTDDEGATIAKEVQSLTEGLGAHAAIVCTSSNVAYAQAISLLRFNGYLVCVGIPEHEMSPIAGAKPGIMIGKHLNIVGSAVGNQVEAIEVLNFAARGVIKTHFRIEKIEALTSVFEEMNRGELKGRVVLDLA